MRVTLVLAALVLGPALSPQAVADADPHMQLVPEWPASFDEARREPIRLLPGPPLEQGNKQAAVEPGSRTAGSSHTFHWTLVNPDGSPGPAGPIGLDASRPLHFEAYLSAGPPSLPTASPATDGPEAGAAPSVTVSARVEIADQVSEERQQTHTLVNRPGAPDVQRYALAFEIDRQRLDPGDGLEVYVTVHQADPVNETLTQPGWRIHTGAEHPTGIRVPLDPAGETDTGAGLALQGTGQAADERVRTGAYATLVASLTAAAWAARRGYRQLRRE